MEKQSFLSHKPKTIHILEDLVLKETIFLGNTTSYREYTLREVSLQELYNLRLSKQPGLVLKKDGKLYYTKFCENVHFTSSNLGPHLCGFCKNVCKHCKKVDDWTVSFHTRTGRKFNTAVYLSGRIEKYNFIPYALETFNCMSDTYLILDCQNADCLAPTF